MEEEADLLEAFSSLPSCQRGWAVPAAGDGVRLTLQLSQRNLPANSQRKYLTTLLLNEAVLEAGAELDASPPAEQVGVLLYAPSPSGRRTLAVRAGNGENSAGAWRSLVGVPWLEVVLAGSGGRWVGPAAEPAAAQACRVQHRDSRSASLACRPRLLLTAVCMCMATCPVVPVACSD
mgnify:CR=1 FL=1